MTDKGSDFVCNKLSWVKSQNVNKVTTVTDWLSKWWYEYVSNVNKCSLESFLLHKASSITVILNDMWQTKINVSGWATEWVIMDNHVVVHRRASFIKTCIYISRYALSLKEKEKYTTKFKSYSFLVKPFFWNFPWLLNKNKKQKTTSKSFRVRIFNFILL